MWFRCLGGAGFHDTIFTTQCYESGRGIASCSNCGWARGLPSTVCMLPGIPRFHEFDGRSIPEMGGFIKKRQRKLGMSPRGPKKHWFPSMIHHFWWFCVINTKFACILCCDNMWQVIDPSTFAVSRMQWAQFPVVELAPLFRLQVLLWYHH